MTGNPSDQGTYACVKFEDTPFSGRVLAKGVISVGRGSNRERPFARRRRKKRKAQIRRVLFPRFCTCKNQFDRIGGRFFGRKNESERNDGWNGRVH